MLDLGVGAMLHDIGKLDLPQRLRHREDNFSPSELRFYVELVAHGVGHARKMGLSAGATLVIAQHHEHADGSMLKDAATRGEPFDLAILDLQMPGMDGLELGHAITADPVLAATRLVLLTSIGLRGQAEKEIGRAHV